MIRQNPMRVALTVLLLGLPATRADAQNGAQPAPSVQPPVIDPEAMTALKKMGEYLRTLDVFQIKVNITRDEVLEDGQKVTFAGTLDLLANRPGQLRVDLNSDREHRLFLFDGKWFTMYAPRLKYYASVAAPTTIKELAVVLEDKYDIELPLIDMFRWGTDEAQISAITGAKSIGESVIDGVTCEHYAFRQDGLDWQVWMQAGDYPLPRKIVLTTLTDDARPQQVAEYTWNLAPSYNNEAFTFVPPKDVTKITLAEVTPMAGAKKK